MTDDLKKEEKKSTDDLKKEEKDPFEKQEGDGLYTGFMKGVGRFARNRRQAQTKTQKQVLGFAAEQMLKKQGLETKGMNKEMAGEALQKQVEMYQKMIMSKLKGKRAQKKFIKDMGLDPNNLKMKDK